MSRIQTMLRRHRAQLARAYAEADPDEIRIPCRHCRDVLLPPGETLCADCLVGAAEDAEEAQAEAVRERRRLGED
jgi:cytidine deaminase